MTFQGSGVLLFVGVSTAGSSIMRLFPRWASELGLDATIEGRDLPVGASPDLHRTVVEEISASDDIAGALVTSHKVGVFQHAGELFDELDDFAVLCREVSCISKRNGRLRGQAKDPITAGLALAHILDEGFWDEAGPEVVCIGGGGAGTAIVVHLLTRGLAPGRIAVADRFPGRVEALRAVCRELDAGEARVVLAPGPDDAARLVEEAEPGSLIINATGMGKDLPGSPLPDDARFPPGGIVWDLNYRGELRFLDQARSQASELDLQINDGWMYFLHGWSEVISEVFALRLDEGRFRRLESMAEPLRPPLDREPS